MMVIKPSSLISQHKELLSQLIILNTQANVQYKDKEDELSALSRRIMLLETESNGADVKLAKTTMEVCFTVKKR